MSTSVIDFRMSEFHDVLAENVRDAAQVEERSADVEIGNIDVPVLIRSQRLREARALSRRLGVPLLYWENAFSISN